ncbi:alpha-ketoglutarate-dependent dioxygenase AlkB family protein [Roseobacter sp. HKCCA0434]|uniref:alpha-ketoglutarate-dependent dioxygenase AlkB family protein n=1 Tax=Roseobacter sp. HKCCA0434 TaxID=3079297 RepID=UPI00290593E8|nr:alpha-ketoglutarate-dependent dioxygenase AlkB [Roseobacter sp. HKCCA0434]
MDENPPPLEIAGFKLWKGLLERPAQERLRDSLRAIVGDAPLVRHVTPGGRPMRVRMSAAGRLGWVSDARGYRYADRHPNGSTWPPIPDQVLSLWHDLTGLDRAPDCCLINHYDAEARMGLHQDRDEGDFSYPVLSISLGDTATFRMGGVERRAPTRSVRLESGDVVLMGGAARLAHHGVDRIFPGTSTLLSGGGRINLTLRVVE